MGALGEGLSRRALLRRAAGLLVATVPFTHRSHHRWIAPAQKLLWTPPGYPTYSGYTTVNIANDGSNRSQTLSTSTDYLIVVDDYDATIANLGGITLIGGRNVVIIGGRIRVSNIAASPTQSTQTAIKVRGGAGTYHFEGLDIGGRNLNDVIALQDLTGGSSSSILQIQNCRLENQLPVGTTIVSGMHPDIVQHQSAIGYPGTVRLYQNTFTSVYQGYFAQNPVGVGVEIRRTNIHPKQDVAAGKTGHVMLWQETRDIPVSFPDNDVYVEENLAESDSDFGQEIYPYNPQGRVGQSQPGDAPTITTDGTGTYAEWPAIAGITGRVYKGVPPGGDYVPDGVAGIGYVSPGYQ